MAIFDIYRYKQYFQDVLDSSDLRNLFSHLVDYLLSHWQNIRYWKYQQSKCKQVLTVLLEILLLSTSVLTQKCWSISKEK